MKNSIRQSIEARITRRQVWRNSGNRNLSRRTIPLRHRRQSSSLAYCRLAQCLDAPASSSCRDWSSGIAHPGHLDITNSAPDGRVLKKVFFAAPGSRVSSNDLPYCIMAAEGIRHSHRALRIVSPLAVHQKTVVMRSWFQVHGSPPDAVRPFLQVDGLLLPIGEITHQLHAESHWRSE